MVQMTRSNPEVLSFGDIQARVIERSPVDVYHSDADDESFQACLPGEHSSTYDYGGIAHFQPRIFYQVKVVNSDPHDEKIFTGSADATDAESGMDGPIWATRYFKSEDANQEIFTEWHLE